MARMLELECPDCATELKLDAGFAGGVCRCSRCGMLMTVPSDPARERTERLTRPASPDGGPTRAASPQSTNSRTQGGKAAQRYVTASGREVRLDAQVAIPTAAPKRMVVRSVTAIGAGSVILGILVAAIVAIVLIVKPAPPEDTSVWAVQDFSYDRANNPWLIEMPNALGMSLGKRTVIIVDAAADSADWLPLLKDAISTGLTRADSGAQLGLVYATADGPETLDDSLTPIGRLDASQLTDFQAPFEAGGQPSLRRALESAIGYDPAQVLIITGRRTEAKTIKALKSLLTGQPEMLLDVITIQKPAVELEQLAKTTGGRVAYLSVRRIEDWHTEANP